MAKNAAFGRQDRVVLSSANQPGEVQKALIWELITFQTSMDAERRHGWSLYWSNSYPPRVRPVLEKSSPTPSR